MVRTSLFDSGGAGKRIGGGVTDAVTRGLDGVHFHRCQIAQDIRGLLQLDPVELDVLTSGKVSIAAVVFAGDMGEHAHLFCCQQAVRHGDAQHVGVTLHI